MENVFNQKNKILVVIDGHALLHRAYHALPPLTTSQGVLINAAYGFFSVFLRMLVEIKPTHIVCCFDLAGPTFRHEKYKKYKAHRVKAPEELYQQLEIIKEVLSVFRVPIFTQQGFEADDLIGTIVAKLKNKPEVKIMIATGDLDTLQLVNDQVSIYTLGKGVNQSVIYTPLEVRKRFDLEPEQMIDFKALKGDPSDNIPGVSGIGEKTAISLLKEFNTLLGLYDKLESGETGSLKSGVIEKLLKNRDQAFFSRELTMINQRVPMKFSFKNAQLAGYDLEEVKAIFKKYEFFSLIKRLPQPVSTDITRSLRHRYSSGRHAVGLANAWPLDDAGSGDDNTQKTLDQIEALCQQNILSPKIAQTEKALVPVISQMTNWGIKLDVDYLSQLSSELNSVLVKISDQIFKLIGHKFNLNSSQQLSEVLFSILGISSKGIRKTPGGAISTSASELFKLRDQHPAISFLEQYRELIKLKSTYVDALPHLVNLKTGRLHAHFNQLGTATGRMSCENPNLQNIPIRTKWGQAVRRAFVAEKGFKLLSADYSQIELRVAAILSKDQKMTAAFQQNLDIHKATAANIFNVNLESVSNSQRQIAKRLNFGILYGMGKRAFAASAGVSLNEADQFIKEYFNDFQGVARYLEGTKDFVARHGYVQTFFGRRRPLPQIHSSVPFLQKSAERMAINMPIQGTAADLIKMAMVNLVAHINNDCRLVCQIHDELLFEIKSDIIAEQGLVIGRVLESVYDFPIQLKIDLKQGVNWVDMGPI